MFWQGECKIKTWMLLDAWWSIQIYFKSLLNIKRTKGKVWDSSLKRYSSVNTSITPNNTSWCIVEIVNALQDLMNDLRSELGGRFEDLILALMLKPEEYDAQELRRSMAVSCTSWFLFPVMLTHHLCFNC